MSEWQDISTAPRDRNILVYFRDGWDNDRVQEGMVEVTVGWRSMAAMLMGDDEGNAALGRRALLTGWQAARRHPLDAAPCTTRQALTPTLPHGQQDSG